MLREQRKLSLDQLSELSGVSKSMLAQIERGRANPTISTVWKIANGFKIPFAQLVTKLEQDVESVEIASIAPLSEDGGHYRNFPLFSREDGGFYEIYHIEADPGTYFSSHAHPIGTQEHITVSAGALEILAGDQLLIADPAHAVRFKGDVPHSYRNRGEILCTLTMVISYAKGL